MIVLAFLQYLAVVHVLLSFTTLEVFLVYIMLLRRMQKASITHCKVVVVIF